LLSFFYVSSDKVGCFRRKSINGSSIVQSAVMTSRNQHLLRRDEESKLIESLRHMNSRVVDAFVCRKVGSFSELQFVVWTDGQLEPTDTTRLIESCLSVVKLPVGVENLARPDPQKECVEPMPGCSKAWSALRPTSVHQVLSHPNVTGMSLCQLDGVPHVLLLVMSYTWIMAGEEDFPLQVDQYPVLLQLGSVIQTSVLNHRAMIPTSKTFTVGGIIRSSADEVFALTCHHCVVGHKANVQLAAVVEPADRSQVVPSDIHLSEDDGHGGTEVTVAVGELGPVTTSTIGNVCPIKNECIQYLVSSIRPRTGKRTFNETSTSEMKNLIGIDAAAIALSGPLQAPLRGECSLLSLPIHGHRPSGRFQYQPFSDSTRSQRVRLSGARHRLVLGTLYPCHTKIYREVGFFRTDKYASYVYESIHVLNAQNLVSDDVVCALFNQYLLELDVSRCVPTSRLNVMKGNSGSLAFDVNGDCVGMLHSATRALAYGILCPLEPFFKLNGWDPQHVSLLL
jgi:hypothetical protein